MNNSLDIVTYPGAYEFRYLTHLFTIITSKEFVDSTVDTKCEITANVTLGCEAIKATDYSTIPTNKYLDKI